MLFILCVSAASTSACIIRLHLAESCVVRSAMLIDYETADAVLCGCNSFFRHADHPVLLDSYYHDGSVDLGHLESRRQVAGPRTRT
ncbi:unnamed protein product [Urochloa humidicola]